MARWTYTLKWIRCGKPNCHCANGTRGHGPYWYAATHGKNGTRWRYIGRINPEAFDPADDAPEPEIDPRWIYVGRINEQIALRILGFIAWPSTLDNLKKRWRILVREHHPDAGGNGDICASINAAYTYAKRAHYA